MIDARALAAVALLALVVSAPVAGQPIPSEDDVAVAVDPAGGDVVWVTVEQSRTDDPEAWIRERAAEADVPVRDVRVTAVQDRTRASFGGVTVDQTRRYWRVRFETSLGDRTGIARWRIAPTVVQTLTPNDDPSVTLEVGEGTRVSGTGVEAIGDSLLAEQYTVDASEAVTYGPDPGRVAVLFGWLAAAFLGPFAAFRRYARATAGADAPPAERVHQIQRVQSRATWLGAVAAGVAATGGAATVTSMALAPLAPAPGVGGWWTVTLWFLALAPFAGAALLGAAAGVHPVLADLRDRDQSTRDRLSEGLRELALRSVQLWVVLALVATLPAWAVGNPVVAGALLAGLVLAQSALNPTLVRLLEDVRPVDDRVRAEVERLWAEHDREPPAVARLETGDARTATAMLAGPVPRRRHLFLTDYLIETLSPAQRRAVAAHELGHAAHGYVPKRIALAAGCGTAVTLALGALPVSGPVAFIAAAGCFVVADRRLAVRLEYDADRFAAAATDPEAVATALDRIAAANVQPRSVEPDRERARRHPSVANRVERLLGEAREE